jgi:hypothetical protein
MGIGAAGAIDKGETLAAARHQVCEISQASALIGAERAELIDQVTDKGAPRGQTGEAF